MERCLAFRCCPLHSPWSWEGSCVQPWGKLQVTLVAQKIPADLIWKFRERYSFEKNGSFQLHPNQESVFIFKAGFLSNSDDHHIHQSLSPCKVTFDPNFLSALIEVPRQIHKLQVHIHICVCMCVFVFSKQGVVGIN